MKGSVQTTGERLQQSLETTLTSQEQLRLKIRIGSALLAAALLIVGSLYDYLLEGQEIVSGMILLLGALIAFYPIFKTAVEGFIATDVKNILEQLVSLALLASLVTGDYRTVILIPLIMSFAHFLEERSIMGAQAAIDGLKTFQAREACLITPDGEQVVACETLNPGDRIKVRPGDMFPVDGEVVQGQSSVDQSSLTGETIPVDVSKGDQVFAGTLNVQGFVEVQVSKRVEETSISKIVELLKEAEQSRTPTMKLIERYASHYLPFVIIVAGSVLFITQDISRVVAILVVSCPCAQLLASPTAMVSSLANASRNGILIKNSAFLEVLGSVKTIIFDKTGTLTVGLLNVTKILPVGEVCDEDLLAAAAAAAQGSNHPVSRAVMRAAEMVDVTQADNVEEKAGFGITATTGQDKIYLGRRSWLDSLKISLPIEPEHHGPVVWVARNGQVLGCILMSDSLRPEAKATIEEVRELGITRTVLLTGDRKQVAAAITGELGLDDLYAERLPSEKLSLVEEEKAKGNPVMVVGDGVNDALALTKADIGVAMGAMGSDIAIKSADVALMSNDLSRLAFSIRLSRMTKAIIYQNIIISAVFSMIMLVLAGIGVITPLVGAFMHNIGAFVVVFNSSRLLRFEHQSSAAEVKELTAPCA